MALDWRTLLSVTDPTLANKLNRAFFSVEAILRDLQTFQASVEAGDIDALVPATRTISTTAPLTGGGTLAADLTLALATDGISNTLLRNSGACSVIGRSANSAGDPADISAGSNGVYLRRASDTLGFGSIVLGDLPSTVIRGGGSGAANRIPIFTDTNTLTSSANGTFDGSNLTIVDRLVTSDPGTTLQTGLSVRVNVAASKTTPRIMMGPTQNVGHTVQMFTFGGRNGAGAITVTGAVVGDVVRQLQAISAGVTGSGAGSFESTISVANQIQQTDGTNLSTVAYIVLLERRSSTGATTERPLYVVP